MPGRLVKGALCAKEMNPSSYGFRWKWIELGTSHRDDPTAVTMLKCLDPRAKSMNLEIVHLNFLLIYHKLFCINWQNDIRKYPSSTKKTEWSL